MVSVAAPRATGRCWQAAMAAARSLCLLPPVPTAPCVDCPLLSERSIPSRILKSLGKSWPKLGAVSKSLAGRGVEVFRSLDARRSGMSRLVLRQNFSLIVPVNQYVS